MGSAAPRRFSSMRYQMPPPKRQMVWAVSASNSGMAAPLTLYASAPLWYTAADTNARKLGVRRKAGFRLALISSPRFRSTVATALASANG